MRPTTEVIKTAAAAAGTIAALAIAGCAPPADSTADTDQTSSSTVDVATGLGFLRARDVHQAQFARRGDGPLYIVWRETAGRRGSDLYISRRGEDAVYVPPVQVNDLPGTVANLDLDEGRAAVALGAGGLVAVAWATGGSDIRAAVSRDAGATFAPSVSLNSDEGAGAYRGFVDIGIDREGVVHGAWIDGRFAPPRAEEPAKLFYARVEAGQVSETNLTDQADSICGCCRIGLDVGDGGRLAIAFRNTGGGYRDVFRLEGDTAGNLGEPQRLGPPMWELRGCPVMGPLNVGPATLWAEASTGKRRVLAATATDGTYEIVAEDTEDWAIERPPRLVSAPGRASELILLPGRPAGKILGGSGVDWRVLIDDVPRWAMSAAVVDGTLVLLGDRDGELQAETRPFDF